MIYFKDCYQHNRLRPEYLNPPLNFSEEIGEGIQDFGSNLLEKFYTSEKVYEK